MMLRWDRRRRWRFSRRRFLESPARNLFGPGGASTPGFGFIFMTINIPNLSLVVLVGPSGSGKSTFARTHFKPTEIISSDFCRGIVADDENDQSATKEAFELLHYIVG